jgi:hypothetical protein
MFGLHNLQPLCGKSPRAILHPDEERMLARPFLNAGRVVASSEKAQLRIHDPSLFGIASTESPNLSLIDAMPWVQKELVADMGTLRAFIRRKQVRTMRTGAGDIVEPIEIHGVTIDAGLLRQYLPGAFGPVRISRCKDRTAGRKKSSALRVRGDRWEVIVMAFEGAPRETFGVIESARKGAAA